MDTNQIEKAKAIIINDIVEYVPNSIVIKTILNKTTGNVRVVSMDIGKELIWNIVPFDTLDQIIDGVAEIVIDGKSIFLATGESIIIPAHCSNSIKANERFKMISTIIKSGYE